MYLLLQQPKDTITSLLFTHGNEKDQGMTGRAPHRSCPGPWQDEEDLLSKPQS